MELGSARKGLSSRAFVGEVSDGSAPTTALRAASTIDKSRSTSGTIKISSKSFGDVSRICRPIIANSVGRLFVAPLCVVTLVKRDERSMSN